MTFLHPTRHFPKLNMELLILLTVLLLLILGLWIAQLLHGLPIERAVPRPVVASPAQSVHLSRELLNEADKITLNQAI
jgi:hypothetical protein